MHVVGSGENLSIIAQRYGLTLQELSNYNGIANPNVVLVGQELAIPGNGAAPHAMAPALSNVLPGDNGYYTVIRGETLSSVARTHGMSMADLMRLNGISDANQIWVGQQLRVSARVAAVTQAAAAQPSELQVAEAIYIVQPNETLDRLPTGNRYCTAVARRQWAAGRRLCLPGPAPTREPRRNRRVS